MSRFSELSEIWFGDQYVDVEEYKTIIDKFTMAGKYVSNFTSRATPEKKLLPQKSVRQ